ncbi:MAG: glycoside hydrolase family 15 protein [Rhodospirillales bacterium]
MVAGKAKPRGGKRAARRIEDYALIGNMRGAALVGRDGSIDWLCLPRFDSPATFAALLGDEENGRWLIAPDSDDVQVTRRYLDGTLILETIFTCGAGRARILDFMALTDDNEPRVVRIVEGLRGRVRMKMDLRFRFDYGRVVPWIRHITGGLSVIAGPDAMELHTPTRLKGEDFTTAASFTVAAGQSVPMVLSWHRSHLHPPRRRSAQALFESTRRRWRLWSGRCTATGEWRDDIKRSAIVLKALTDGATGGIVAAPTTSLPERIGGVRNWDYRYCWLRDATFTLFALIMSGYREEAAAWQRWLTRAVAGEPSKLQIMYGLGGEQRLDEYELPWLDGFGGSKPVRIGNAAFAQRQLDVFGEVIDAFQTSRVHKLKLDDQAWPITLELMSFLQDHWQEPDSGIWEQRGPLRQHTHSRVMAWVAVDRAIKAVERFRLEGPLRRWRHMRAVIHREVCAHGYDAKRNTFLQHYGGKALDASTLLIPLVGFLPPTDKRVIGTVEAIQRELMADGFVLRYPTEKTRDGLPPGEGAFLMCSFWLADNLALLGRYDESRALFERLLDARNDVGLLAEEYDPRAKRQLGNFPQAFSHVGIINTAHNLTKTKGPADRRAKGK